MIQICHLFRSPGHSFVGHHGHPPGPHPIVEVDYFDCVAGQGVRSDRYFGHKPDYKGQITFFSLEVLEELRHALHLPAASPAATRRNVVTRGADLNAWIGREFELQGLRFAGVEECQPCGWMNLALGPGAEVFLRGRGGLRARILSDGILRRDPGPAAAPGSTTPPT